MHELGAAAVAIGAVGAVAVGAAAIRRRQEDVDPVGSEQSCLLYNLNLLYSDLNRSLYTSGTAEEILTRTIVYGVF